MKRKHRSKLNKTRNRLRGMPANGRALVSKMNLGKNIRIHLNARKPKRKIKRVLAKKLMQNKRLQRSKRTSHLPHKSTLILLPPLQSIMGLWRELRSQRRPLSLSSKNQLQPLLT